METPFDYTWREWQDHLSYFAELSLREQSTVGSEEVTKYFPRQYSNQAEALYKSERFSVAQAYLEEHLADFEKAELAIASSKTAISSQHLQLGLYRFYSHAPNKALYGTPPPVELIISLARQSKKL